MENIEVEIWKDIEGYEGYYQVSSLCRFKSLSRDIVKNNSITKSKDIIMKKMASNFGYYAIEFYKNKKRKRFLCHKIFAIYFILNKENKPFVNHINGIKTDNRIENLEWCSSKENNNHALKTGLRKPSKGYKHHWSIINEDKVLAIRRLYRIKPKTSKIKLAKKLNITTGAIYGILKNTSWKHLN